MTVPFDKNFVHDAWEKNKAEQGDLYHHPTEKGIIVKNIDLSSGKPLHGIHNEPEGKNTSAEKWLEAYIIQKAKHSNNYEESFELAGSKYRFLYSQLNFRSEGKNGSRPLDCLLFEPASCRFIIIELKIKRELKKAISELDYYAYKVDEIKNELMRVFELKGIPTIEGYIVWPANDRADNSKHDFGRWGLIEYSDDYGMIEHGRLIRPWEKYQSLGQKLEIRFVKKKPSEVFQSIEP
jgi:hypothetical protein